MLELRTLGQISLERGGHPVEDAISQPKRFALLAILGVATSRLQRDELLLLLWPDSPQSRARAALRQAVHFLKASIGHECFLGDDVPGLGLDPSVVRCDARELLEAAEREDHERVVELYAGPFLPGFHFDDAPREFEGWLDQVRGRVRAATHEAMFRTAEDALERGDLGDAVQLATRAIRLEPYSEASFRRFLRIAGASGARAEGSREYRDFVARCERELGSSPSALTARAYEAFLKAERRAPVEAPDPHGIVEPDPTAGAVAVRAPGRSDGVEAQVGRSQVEAPGVEGPGVEPSGVEPSGVERSGVGRSRARAGLLAVAALAVVALLALMATLRDSGSPGLATPALALDSVVDLGFPETAPDLARYVTAQLESQLGVVAGGAVAGSGGGGGILIRTTVARADPQVEISSALVDRRSGVILDRLTLAVSGDSAVEPIGRATARLAAEIRSRASQHARINGLAARARANDRDVEALRIAARETAVADSLRRAGMPGAAGVAYRLVDSVYTEVQGRNPGWSEPVVARGQLKLKEIWLSVGPDGYDSVAIRRIARAGLALTDTAGHRDPRLFATRGDLWKWLGHATADPARQRGSWGQARASVDRALALDPGLADAWRLRSWLAHSSGDFPDSYYSARRAYAADRSLRFAPELLGRLAEMAPEVGAEQEIGRWCRELHERLPGSWLADYCRVQEVAWTGPWDTGTVSAAVRSAGEGLSPGDRDATVRSSITALEAVAHARGGRDRVARSTLASIPESHHQHPEVAGNAAWAWLLIGEVRRAESILDAAIRASPASARVLLNSVRFDGVPSSTGRLTVGYVGP